MRKRYTAAAVLALLAALAGGAALVDGAGGPKFPPVTIPGLPPTGKCCLIRVQKTAVEGTRLFRFGDPYVCNVGNKAHKVERGPAELDMILIPGDPHCDEMPNLIPKGSRLKAIGTMTRRIDDGFSHFIATFTIANGNIVLFKGELETIDNISTHHKPFGNDPCDLKRHLQGWLVGVGVDKSVAQYTLRAMLEATIVPGNITKDQLTPASMDGVFIECH